MPVTLIHSLVADIALVLLIIVMVAGSRKWALKYHLKTLYSYCFFGFSLFGRPLRKRRLANGLLSIYAIVTVAGFVLLIFSNMTTEEHPAQSTTCFHMSFTRITIGSLMAVSLGDMTFHRKALGCSL